MKSCLQSFAEERDWSKPRNVDAPKLRSPAGRVSERRFRLLFGGKQRWDRSSTTRSGEMPCFPLFFFYFQLPRCFFVPVLADNRNMQKRAARGDIAVAAYSRVFKSLGNEGAHFDVFRSAQRQNLHKIINTHYKTNIIIIVIYLLVVESMEVTSCK